RNSKHSGTSPTVSSLETCLNLQGASCPMAFVEARLFLDQKHDGEIVDIIYENTAANKPLVRSIQGLGHNIVSNLEDALASPTSPPENNTDPHSASKLQLIKVRIQVKK
ncbi:MAG: sulfurtransferase TusA family protein, partial [Kordiimonadaceae bacterium]|nr:sulfurtransferase TusA family protein [Kordiimonadaceae bacterium]